MDHFDGHNTSNPTPVDQNLADNVAAAMGGGDGTQHGRPSHTHMTFYWGKDSEILFTGWPGSSAAMYALAVALVFLLAGFIEWLTHRGVCGSSSPRAAAAHVLRVAVTYVVMLAVMSFNVGILVAIVAGHALGYIWFAELPAARSFETREEEPAGPPTIAC